MTTVVSPTPVGDYSINVSGSVGAVMVVQSGRGVAANYTVSVKTPFKLTGRAARCRRHGVATFTVTGPSYSASQLVQRSRCAVLGHQSLSIPSWLNSDNSITLSLNEVIGLYLLTRTGNVTTVVSPTPVGDYSINVSGSVGAVTVVQSGTGAAANYTVSVKTPFKLTGASCALPVGTWS